MAEFFLELSIVMVLVLVISFIMNKIKQPLLIGYILTGLIAGPLFLNILSSSEGYETFAHIGIALLLFIVGLHLNLKLVKEVGAISLITGLGQVLFTTIVGFGINYLLGYSLISSLIIAICLTFSSTIIIVKLLSDKRDLETLYGKISMGFLIVQDLVAVIILMALSAFLVPRDVEQSTALFVGITVLSIIAAVSLTYILSKTLLPKLLQSISQSTELLFVFVISWCLGIAALFDYLGFSLEVGALLAGVALASSPYQSEISSRIKPLRDFFIVMFFILLGSQMVPEISGIEDVSFAEKFGLISEVFAPILLPAIILSLFVLIGNPLIVIFLMSYLKYSTRTGFLAGLTVAQISEFGLIVGMLALQAGLITSSELSMITLVGIITITASTYMILNGEYLYSKFQPLFKHLDNRNLKDSKQSTVHTKKYDIIIFGFDRVGFSLLKTIKTLGDSYIIIDNDPQIIKKLKSQQISCMYADANNVEFLEEIDFENSKLCISTIPYYETNSLISSIFKNKQKNPNSLLFLTSRTIDEALDLYQKGADYVILPHFLGGDYVSLMVKNNYHNIQELVKEKVLHINDLKLRKEQGHEHPKRR
ncbi:MAG: cation:proton antiporter [Nanoarchaeota archaeon]|nr:cation:proton antiporter [Nanoarchaeota archaeon]